MPLPVFADWLLVSQLVSHFTRMLTKRVVIRATFLHPNCVIIYLEIKLLIEVDHH